MSPESSTQGSGWDSQRCRDAESNGHALHLLRNTHIFAAAVHELLELQILRDLTAGGLAPAHFHLLKLMVRDGGHQIGEVAGFLGVSAPAASKIVDKLERLELVVRHPSKNDRRVTLVAPSTKGRRLVREYSAALGRRLAPVFAEFDHSEIGQLADWLERFARCLIAQQKHDEGLCLRCAALYDERCFVGALRGDCSCRQLLSHLHAPVKAEGNRAANGPHGGEVT